MVSETAPKRSRAARVDGRQAQARPTAKRHARNNVIEPGSGAGTTAQRGTGTVGANAPKNLGDVSKSVARGASDD
jgi:hypothetical protein